MITITDILGFEIEVSRNEVITKINPVIENLSKSICDEILLLNNHQPPKAVMLVGGGSLTPELPKKIAQHLNLPENRVAIRDISAISSVSIAEHIEKGPELVTPIGIAIAAQQSPVQYRTVYINEQPVRLFEVKKLTAGDCLLASGIKMNQLYGKPGLAMIITLNGKSITIPGGHGKAPTIMRNGKECSLDDPVEHEDHLLVISGHDGEQPEVSIKDLLDGLPQKTVYINGKPHTVVAKIFCNGLPTTIDKQIFDRDQIEFNLPASIEDLLKELNLHHEMNQLHPFRVNINGKETFLPPFSGKIFRNGIRVKASNSYEHLDEITIENKKQPTVLELADMKQVILSHSIPVSFNGKQIVLTKKLTEFRRDGEVLSENDLINDGDHIEYEQKKMEPFLFQDLFNHVQINMPEKATSRFILLKNNQQTTFFGKIEPGDDLKIDWPS